MCINNNSIMSCEMRALSRESRSGEQAGAIFEIRQCELFCDLVASYSQGDDIPRLDCEILGKLSSQ